MPMAQIQSGNPQNNPTDKSVRTRSTFPLQYNQYGTYRFGHIMPHFVMEGVSSDSIKFRSAHEVRSFNLQAPLMEDVALKKDYFAVPMTAILPLNWDKFYTNPVIGSDVPTECGPSLSGFYAKVATWLSSGFSSIKTFLGDNTGNAPSLVTAVIRYSLVCESLFSNGSLPAYLGIHLNRYFSCTVSSSTETDKLRDFDWFFDQLITCLNEQVSSVVVTNPDGSTNRFVMGSYSQALDTRDFIEYMRDNLSSWVSTVSLASGKTLATLKAAWNEIFWNFDFEVPSRDVFNTSRLWAYQLVVSHYYSNDNIDYIFDANLFRQYIWQLFTSMQAGTYWSAQRNFTVNGLSYDFDALSAYVLGCYLDYAIGGIPSSTSWSNFSSSNVRNTLAYWSALFSFKRSLRFKDYFTGSRSLPLAVGDVNVYINDAGTAISVIDVTKNIQKQRLLNAVNRMGRRFSDYMEGLFGKKVAPDYTQPFYLAHTSDIVYGSETENTGDGLLTDAQTTRSNFRSNGSRYEFTYEPDRDCIVIGVTYFDIARAYCNTIDRQALHLDRYDWFNPYQQFVGDQEVYAAELGAVVGRDAQQNPDFAYQLRNMEYKQRFNQACGGFVSQLPGWCFLADDKFRDVLHISPDYIRSRPTELDKFYNSLSGYALGSYFHFIVKNVNDCTGSRPMAYAPTIL